MRRRVSTLSSWFTWLEDEEINVGNPAARVRRPLNGLPISEACSPDVDDLDGARYQPTLRIVGKGDLIAAVVTFATDPLRSTIPHDGAPAERVRGHLATLAAMMRAQPDLFVVLAEIDLRARRDPAIAAAVKTVEDGWRNALTKLLTSIEARGDPGALTELVIATVKGIRLHPASAPDVLDALATLLSRRTATGTTGGGP